MALPHNIQLGLVSWNAGRTGGSQPNNLPPPRDRPDHLRRFVPHLPVDQQSDSKVKESEFLTLNDT